MHSMLLKYKLSLNASNNQILRFFLRFIKQILKYTEIKHSFFFLKKKKKTITLLKAPHVYKKAREQFIFFKHKAIFKIWLQQHITFLKFIVLNKPTEIKISLKKIA